MVEEINFRVIEKQVVNLDKILFTVSFAVLAQFDIECNMWTYLKYKGPLFLVQDKKKDKKIVLLNQYVSKDLIIPINNDAYEYELKDLGNGQSMLNYALKDSISGLKIRGIWSQDGNLKNIFKAIGKQ